MGKDKEKKISNKIEYNEANIKNDLLEIFSFKTGNKNDFSVNDILYLQNGVDRAKSRDQINSFTKDYYITRQIEYGIFEFVLTRIKHLGVISFILPNMYDKMVNEICENLDIKNSRIKNTTLLPKILNNEINPFIIAFLNPHQIHPDNWKKELDRQIETRKLANDMPTTDLYKCYKCGARKSIVAQVQIRSADEPMTLFITCTECHNTYTKNG